MNPMFTMHVDIAQSHSIWPFRRAQRWFFTISAANGNALAVSETYTNKADCISAACAIFDQNRPAVLHVPGQEDLALRESSGGGTT